MSAWVLMGLPTSIYALGLGQVWISVGLAIGYTISWLVQAPRLRRFSIVANDSITIPQYLTNRFLSGSRALQIICAAVFLVAYTIYSASSVKACGTLFNTVIGLNETVAMYIAAIIIVSYTFPGWVFRGLLDRLFPGDADSRRNAHCPDLCRRDAGPQRGFRPFLRPTGAPFPAGRKSFRVWPGVWATLGCLISSSATCL